MPEQQRETLHEHDLDRDIGHAEREEVGEPPPASLTRNGTGGERHGEQCKRKDERERERGDENDLGNRERQWLEESMAGEISQRAPAHAAPARHLEEERAVVGDGREREVGGVVERPRIARAEERAEETGVGGGARIVLEPSLWI